MIFPNLFHTFFTLYFTAELKWLYLSTLIRQHRTGCHKPRQKELAYFVGAVQPDRIYTTRKEDATTGKIIYIGIDRSAADPSRNEADVGAG